MVGRILADRELQRMKALHYKLLGLFRARTEWEYACELNGQWGKYRWRVTKVTYTDMGADYASEPWKAFQPISGWQHAKYGIYYEGILHEFELTRVPTL